MMTNETLSLPYRLGVLVLILAAWLAVYFLINRREVDPERRKTFDTELDRKTPFWPPFAIVYFSTYIFVIQPFLVLSDARQFYWMAVTFSAITILSSIIHAAVPSKIERMELAEVGGVSGLMLNLFQKTCKPYGNFPSMHVGLSVPVVAANYMAGGPVVGTLTLIWGVLIALSTLFTKQHTILDVLAGLTGGLLVFFTTFALMMH